VMFIAGPFNSSNAKPLIAKPLPSGFGVRFILVKGIGGSAGRFGIECGMHPWPISRAFKSLQLAIKPTVGASVNHVHALGHSRHHPFQMLGDLSPGGTITVAQFSAYELFGFREKRQNRLKTFLPLFFGL